MTKTLSIRRKRESGAIPRVRYSHIPETVIRLSEILGPDKSFIVGGVLRDAIHAALERGDDALLPARYADWDMATPLRPQEVIRRLRKAGVVAAPIGIEHGTVAAVLEGETIEITTFRHDLESIDGRHAVVRFADSLEEDLQRRDFTINAFAMDIETGEIIDMFGGMADLNAARIRAVGDPNERFREDYLRMLRANRFAGKLHGVIEPDAAAAIRRNARCILDISAERIRDELMKLLGYEFPSHGFVSMRETGLLIYVLPELDAGFDCWQNRFHSDDVAMHTLLTVDAIRPSETMTRWMALLHDLGKVPRKLFHPGKSDYVFYGHQYASRWMAKRIMRRLRFSNREIEITTAVVENHMYNLKPGLSDSAIKRFVRRLGRDNIDPFLRMRMADRRGNRFNDDGYEKGIFHFVRTLRRIERADEAMGLKDLLIDGNDLIDLGLRPSPVFSVILNQLLEAVLDDSTLNNRFWLIERAQEFIQEYRQTGTIQVAEKSTEDDPDIEFTED